MLSYTSMINRDCRNISRNNQDEQDSVSSQNSGNAVINQGLTSEPLTQCYYEGSQEELSQKANAYLTDGLPALISSLGHAIPTINFSRDHQIRNYSAHDGMSKVVDRLIPICKDWQLFSAVPGFKDAFIKKFEPVLKGLGSAIDVESWFEQSQDAVPFPLAVGRKRVALGVNAEMRQELQFSGQESLVNDGWVNAFKLNLNTNRVESTSTNPTRVATDEEWEKDVRAARFLSELYRHMNAPVLTPSEQQGSTHGLV